MRKLKTPIEDHLFISEIIDVECFEKREVLIDYFLDKEVQKVCNDLDFNMPIFELSDIYDDDVYFSIQLSFIKFQNIFKKKQKNTKKEFLFLIYN